MALSRKPIALGLILLLTLPSALALIEAPRLPISPSLPGGDVHKYAGVDVLVGPDGEKVEVSFLRGRSVIEEVLVDGNVSMRLVATPEVAPRLAPGVLDVSSRFREGTLDRAGHLRVIVAHEPGAVLAALASPVPLPRFGLTIGTIHLDALAALAASPGLVRVHPDSVRELHLAESVPLVRATELHQERDAEGIQLRGAGTTIAILDTGIDHTHPDFGSCLAPVPPCRVTAVNFLQLVPFENPVSTEDENGHGTHVASIAAGAKGVAPEADILALKVCTRSGTCYDSAILQGLSFAALMEADVVSMSFGGPGTSDGPLATAVDDLVRLGIVAVSASGNGGAETIGEPAASLLGIAVGASDKQDRLASFSSYGPVVDARDEIRGVKPDVVAPGVDIRAALPAECLYCSDKSRSGVFSGTSMAAPHVAGLAALLRQAAPDLTPAGVKAALAASPRRLDASVLGQGSGRIDAMTAWSSPVRVEPALIFAGEYTRVTQTYDATGAFEVRNLGSEPIPFVLRATHDPRFSLTFEPPSGAVPPQESVHVTWRIVADRDTLPDGWHEAVARLDSSGTNLSEVRLAFLKTASLVIRTDVPYETIFLTTQDWSEFIDGNGGRSLRIRLPAGTYHAMAGFLGCPTRVVACPDGSMSLSFSETIHVTDQQEVTLDRESAEHQIALIPRYVDGTAHDPTAPSCDVAEAPPCHLTSHAKYSRAGASGWSYFRLEGPDSHLHVSSAASEWTVGRLETYTDGDRLFLVQNATQGVTSSLTFEADPAQFGALDVEPHYPPGHDEGVVDFQCWIQVETASGTPFYIWPIVTIRADLHSGERGRYLVQSRHGSHELVEGAHLPIVSCGSYSEWVKAGTWTDYECDHPQGCHALGYSQDQLWSPGRLDQHLWYVREAPYDDRFTRDDGVLHLFEGAAGFIGSAGVRNGSLRLWAPYLGPLYFVSGGSGLQYYGQAASPSGVHGRITLDDEVVVDAPVSHSVRVPLGAATRAEVSLAFDASLMDGYLSRAEHRWSTDRLNETLWWPQVAWVRTNHGTSFTTRFNAGDDATLRFVIVRAADEGRPLAEVSGRLERDGVMIPLSLHPLDEVTYEATIPGLAEGAYDLVVEGVGNDGTRFDYKASPVLVVGLVSASNLAVTTTSRGLFPLPPEPEWGAPAFAEDATRALRTRV